MMKEAFPACRKTRKIAIGVDANAEVGPQEESDDPGCMGKFALGARSPSGHLFLAWARERRLIIANAFFRRN